MSDRSLRQDVINALTCHPGIDSANIGVAGKDGIITLSGYVPSYWQKTSTEDIVARVKGVMGIADEIKVSLFGAPANSDEVIAKRALNSIKRNVPIPNDVIQVKVDRGMVTLYGTVEWQHQKELATEAICGLSGVEGIFNKIEVTPRVASADVKTVVEDTLKRDLEHGSEAIR